MLTTIGTRILAGKFLFKAPRFRAGLFSCFFLKREYDTFVALPGGFF